MSFNYVYILFNKIRMRPKIAGENVKGVRRRYKIKNQKLDENEIIKIDY